MSECQEVGLSILEALAIVGKRFPSNMDEARDIVKKVMPDESVTVIDNVAQSLLRQSMKFLSESEQ